MSKKLNLKIFLSVIMLICCLSMLVLTGCANGDGQPTPPASTEQPTTETITSESAYNTIKTALLLNGESEIDVAKYFGKYELQADYERSDIYGYQISESYKQYVDYTNGTYNEYLIYDSGTYRYFNGEVTYELGVYGESTTGIVENNHERLRPNPWFDHMLTQGMYDNGGYEENAIKITSENGYSLTLSLNLKGYCYLVWTIEQDYIEESTFEEYYERIKTEQDLLPESEHYSNTQSYSITITFENDEVSSIGFNMSDKSQPSYDYVDRLLTDSHIQITISKFNEEIATPEWVIEYLESQLESAKIA